MQKNIGSVLSPNAHHGSTTSEATGGYSMLRHETSILSGRTFLSVRAGVERAVKGREGPYFLLFFAPSLSYLSCVAQWERGDVLFLGSP